MKLSKTLLALGVGTALGAVSTVAFAGTPCKFYLKLSGGYGATNNLVYKSDVTFKGGDKVDEDKTLSDYKFPSSKPLKGFIGDVEVGYNFNENIRLGVSFSYGKYENKNMPFNDIAPVMGNLVSPNNGANGTKFISDPKAVYRASSTSYVGMATAYYDFKTMGSITPYVLAGIGIQRLEGYIDFSNTTVTNPSNGSTDLKPKFFDKESKNPVSKLEAVKKNKAIFKLGGGISYKFTDSLALDLTYAVSNFNRIEFAESITQGFVLKDKNWVLSSLKGLKTDNTMFQSVVAGIKFEF